MSETMQLEIVSATEAAAKVTVKEVYVPGYLGETGVLENHRPYVSLLEPGEINYTDVEGKKSYLFVREGFIEVNDNNVVVISDTVEPGESLSSEEIEAKLAEIEAQMDALQGKDMSAEELETAPEKWKEVLAEKKEWEVKRAIFQKVKQSK
ncbi:MAG: ATP synthase F1 subunit epsilon [bacterium]|nr:ATP synthase F1 subunit epsilon [bacterium]